jgi:hypothetical protein
MSLAALQPGMQDLPLFVRHKEHIEYNVSC